LSDKTDSRRMRLLQELYTEPDGVELAECASKFKVDERSIRRDIDFLHDLLAGVEQIEIRRGRVVLLRKGFGASYFTSQINRNEACKLGIAKAVVKVIPDNSAILLTAGTTTYFVAKEIHRAHLNNESPKGLIAFTNSLPALLEFTSAGIKTGIVGDVYNEEDCAFHSQETLSNFHPSLLILGSSGIAPNADMGLLELYSQRAEEAAFLKQLILRSPEIILAADSSKLGARHPWAFTSETLLKGKKVHLFTSELEDSQIETLNLLAQRASFVFEYTQTYPDFSCLPLNDRDRID